MSVKKKCLRIIAVILLVASIGLGVYAFNIWQSRREDRASVKQMQADFYAASNTIEYVDGEESPTTTVATTLMRYSIEPLKQINEQVVGWILVPGTEVDYAIMQDPNSNNTYLYRDMYGNSGSGVPFMSKYNVIGQERENYLVYGHHFVSGTLGFSTLTRYLSQEFYDEHPCFYVLMEDGIVYECQIYSVFHTQTSSGYDQTSFDSVEEKEKYLEMVVAESVVNTNVDVSGEDITITLSTCDGVYGGAHGRLAIGAKLQAVELTQVFE